MGYVKLSKTENQDEQSIEERILLAPINKIATLVLSSNFLHMLWPHAYHQIQKRYAHLHCDAIPYLSKIGKESPSLILGWAAWIIKHPMSWCDKTCPIYEIKPWTWGGMNECKRNYCLLLVYDYLVVIPKANP